MQKIKKLQARGLFDADKEDPFELFVSSTQIRWCYYKETQKVLGNTYGMAVLQDFEAITPNILCRTIETVEGGGIVVLLLHTMSSLKQLYTLTMDVHDRFRTGAHADVVGRFNERFILSLANCQSCLVLDDELNVLPISRHAKNIIPLPGPSAAASYGASAEDGIAAVESVQTEADRELQKLKASMASTAMVGGLVNSCATLDQAKAVLTFAEAISEKSLRSTVALTAGRGRGKSAALGLAIAAAVGYGYSNIFVTSPSPENLKTLFEFVFKGLEALAYKEHADYEAIASTNPEFNKAIVRVNVFRGHRQTIQYLSPEDSARLGQCELLVVDEAAAIPLPLVKKLLGPYLVFLASTVNGYEGTGRSLSLKLIQQLRIANASGGGSGGGGAGAMTTSGGAGGGSSAMSGRTLREVLLSEPIRYSSGDQIESWLNDLLCLDATTPYRLGGRLPAPTECALYAVDRDALFSYHKVSEAFLHRMMSLYVSSHYKNSPNDLQLMSDAPAHKLFVLLGPQGSSTDPSGLPDILCVLQVCLEGEISKDSLKAALARGNKGSGDLIPWTLAQQFQEDGFASLSGARVVRIATHPDATKMGYGTRALQLLSNYYSGKLVNLAASDDEEEGILDVDLGLHRKAAAAASSAGDKKKKGKDSAAADDDDDGEGEGEASLATEKVKPRKELPPLLVPCTDIRRPARLHWLGVSYGLTLQLFNFWRRAGYLPTYLRQTANELTAEHTMIMLRELDTTTLPKTHPLTGKALTRPKKGWIMPFVADFGRRFMSLLSFEFRSFDATLALSVMDAACSGFGFGATAAAAAAAEAKEGASSSSAEDGSSSALVPAPKPLNRDELRFLFTPHDLKRLDAYSRSLVDYHLIMDLLPSIARLYFSGRLLGGGSGGDEGGAGAGTGGIPRLQAGILLALGLQHVPIETVSAHFDLADNQVLALFHKSIRKLSGALASIEEKTVASEVDREAEAANAKAAALLAASKAATASGKKHDSSAKKDMSAVAVAVLEAEGDLKKYAVPSAVVAAAAAATTSTSAKKETKADGEPAKKKQKKEEKEEESSSSDSDSDSSTSSSSSDSDSDSDSSHDDDEEDEKPAVPETVRLPKPSSSSAPLSGNKRSHGEMEGSSSGKKGKEGGGFGGFAKDELYDERGLMSKGKGGKKAKSAR
jgi:N-acetyltransferase 10